MKVLFDVGHPAHVHLFHYVAKGLQRDGHQVLFTARDKESEIYLLKKFGLPYISFGKHRKSKIAKMFGLIDFTAREVMAAIKFKPDIFLSHGSIYAAWAAFLTGKTNLAVEDTGNWEQVRLYLPVTKAVITSTSFPISYGDKQVYYEGYHELAYLHPNYFTPDKSVVKDLGVKDGEPYYVLRFVSWDASHDIGQSGLKYEQKKELIRMLSERGKVFISSEKPLNADFDKYRFPLPFDRMHDALAFADLFIGEGVTMASECAVLGTPAVYVNSLERGYTQEQEKKYGLTYNFSTSEGVVEKVAELLKDKELKAKAAVSRQRLLDEKIDVSAFLVWFLENWPKSMDIIQKDSNYQYRFR